MTPQPPAAGAVDLAGLKNAPNEDQIGQAIHQALGELNLVCDCGNLIERGGQEIMCVAVGMVPGPNRQPQRGMKVDRKAFCSASCDYYEMFKSAAMNAPTLLVVSRPLPHNIWFKKPSERTQETQTDA